MKHLLKLGDLSGEEIIELLNLADQLKYERKNGIPHPHLAGKTLGMIFRKPVGKFNGFCLSALLSSSGRVACV